MYTENAEPMSMELGQIVCKHCNQILGTVPTNGYKKFYGACDDARCNEHQACETITVDD